MGLMTTTEMFTGVKNWVLEKIALIQALIPAQASSSNQLADKAFVNSSIATATATFRGTYNLVSDLELTTEATQQQIAAALATMMAARSITPDNQDYAFVQVPTDDATPTEIEHIDRYKYNGSVWEYEYTLNNSGFTAEQWAAINSGVTSGDMTKLRALPTSAELTALLDGKQNVIQDLAAIRSGASAGTTAVQPAALSAALVQTVAESGVFDLSVHNAVNGVLATYADLSAALTALNALSSEYKKPGMSFKFVRSSDNKYVQYRLMANTFSTTVTDWQGVDDEPTEGSENLVKSSGIFNEINKYAEIIDEDFSEILIDKDDKILESRDINGKKTFHVDVKVEGTFEAPGILNQEQIDQAIDEAINESVTPIGSEVEILAESVSSLGNIASYKDSAEYDDFTDVLLDKDEKIVESLDIHGNRTFYTPVRFISPISELNGKKLLAIGDSITAPEKWQAEVARLHGMTFTTHAMGGIGIITMVDGNGGSFPALSSADVADVDIIIVHGFYNERTSTYTQQLAGDADDMYPQQNTFCGRLNYLVKRIYEELANSNNTKCKVFISAPHNYGRYPYNDNSAYDDGQTICKYIKMIANRHSLYYIDCMNGANINKYNWNYYTLSDTPISPTYIVPTGETNDGERHDFPSFESLPPYNECPIGSFATVSDSSERGYEVYRVGSSGWGTDPAPAPWCADQLHLNNDGYIRLGEFIAGQLRNIN